MMRLMRAEVNGRLYVILFNGDDRKGLAIDCGWVAEESDQMEFSFSSGATAKVLGKELGETELVNLFRDRLLGLTDAPATQAQVPPEIIRRVEHLYVIPRNDEDADDRAVGLGIVFPLAEVHVIGSEEVSGEGDEGKNVGWKDIPGNYNYLLELSKRLGLCAAAIYIVGPFEIYFFGGRDDILVSLDPEERCGRRFVALFPVDVKNFRDSQALTEVPLNEAPDRVHYLSPGNYLIMTSGA